MNLNCPRDPLTCKCDYHLGFDDRLNAAFGGHLTGRGYPERWCSCAVLRMIGNPSVPIVEKPGPFHLPESWKPTDPQMLEGTGLYVQQSGGAMRPPIAPGVLLDDEPASFYARLRRPRDWYGIRRLAARWAGALAMVVGAAAIMYAEGQRQPAPGVGFGIALALLMGAALLLGRSNGG